MNEELMQEYPNASEQRKAEIENFFWEINPNKNGCFRRNYIKSVLGTKTRLVEIRNAILNTHPEVQRVIWDLVDREHVSLYTVARLLSEAKDRSKKKNISLKDSFNIGMEQYKKLSFVVVNTTTGKNYRRKRGSFSEESVVHATTSNNNNSTETPDEDVAFWAHLRKSITAEMFKRLDGVDPLVTTHLLNDLESELRSVVDSFQSKIYRVRKREIANKASSDPQISRSDVVHSCRTLHMDPPSTHGKPVDLKFARRQKHKLVRLYHPDRHHGDESARPRYEEVIRAFDVLTEYMSTVENNQFTAVSTVENHT